MDVELIDYFGNDLMVINAARVSFGKSKKRFEENDEKLMKYLVDHGHTSVFRHPQLQFRITCPIYVERQLFKHQVGISINSISGRYVDFSDTYTTIKKWRKQSKSSKQGSEGEVENQYDCQLIEDSVIDFCQDAYKKLIALGVSKEQARTILPLNLNTQFIWTGSLLAFIHLCKLRLKPDAQTETRAVVSKMLNLISNLSDNPFENTLKVWNFEL